MSEISLRGYTSFYKNNTTYFYKFSTTCTGNTNRHNRIFESSRRDLCYPCISFSLNRKIQGSSRPYPVELIVNGEPVDTALIEADGTWKDVNFEYNLIRSSWVALRIYPSSHTNPVYILVDGKPITSAKSAAWCSKAVVQCWKMKESKIRAEDKHEAEAAYKKAKAFYDNMAKGATID